ncbi:MAG: agmatine deiminase family protein, partial [Myxococcales bacterium]|nr:agmatine deiminase family protein [Myxococcales bacterium]
MRFSISFSILLAALGAFGCTADGASKSLEGGPLSGRARGDAKTDVLPATPTGAEQQGKADGNDPRDQYPGSYGFTNPPSVKSAVAGEFEPINTFFIGWGSGAWENEQFFAEIIRASADEVTVTIVVPDQQSANALDSDLAGFGVNMANVQMVLYGVDTIWMRDYGPLAAASSSGALTLVDPRYYWGRWMDDYFPTALANADGLPASRPPIEMEGGNFQSDGQGRCVATDAHVERNYAFGYTAADIKNLFAAYYGCQQTTLVPALSGEGTGHVDMSVHVTGPGEVIVGQYTTADDSVNAKRLDQAAQMLANDGFLVRRVPMPKNDRRSVFRSYTNAL